MLKPTNRLRWYEFKPDLFDPYEGYPYKGFPVKVLQQWWEEEFVYFPSTAGEQIKTPSGYTFPVDEKLEVTIKSVGEWRDIEIENEQ